MRNIFKKIVAFVLIGVLAVAFSGNMQASADDGGKAYKYRFDLSKAYLGSEYTKLGIVMFAGDSLVDVSEDTHKTEDGCEYNGYYMGFDAGSFDTSLYTAEKRTKSVKTGEVSDGGEKEFEGVSGLTIKGDRPVIVDGGEIVESGPYQIMVDGKMVQHNSVLYKPILMHVMEDYTVNYELDGGEFGTASAQTSFTPGKVDSTYKIPTPVKKGYRFCGWRPDSRTVAIDVEGADTLVIKGLYDSDEETMQGKIRQANALYNNGGYTVTASWDKVDEEVEATTEVPATTELTGTTEVPGTTELPGTTETTATTEESVTPDVKIENTLSVKGKSANVKYSKLKKKAQSLSITKVITFADKGQGGLSYSKASGNKKIGVNKKTGKIAIKKGVKKGTYKLTIKVKAAGNDSYEASGWKSVTCKIIVK